MYETMARRLRGTLVAAVLLAGLVGIGAGPAGAAGTSWAPFGTQRAGRSGDLVVTLPFARAGKLVVEPTTSRIFAAGDDRIAVLTAAGAPVAVIDTMYGATEVTVGGGYVWVLLTNTSSIARIDPATLAVTRWSAGSLGPLQGLAYAGGRLWSTSAPAIGTGGSLVGLDPATGSFTSTANGFYGEGQLVASPSAPNLLVGAETGISAHELVRWNVSTGTPVEQAREREDGFIRGLAITADGTRLLTTSGSPYVLVERTLSTLALSGTTYPMSAYPVGVATSAARGGLIAAQSDAYYDDVDTWVYPTGAPTPVLTADLSGEQDLPSSDPADDAVDFTPDGSALVSMTYDSYGVTTQTRSTAALLHILPLVPSITSTGPVVVGTRGGASIVVSGKGLGTVASARIGGVAVPITSRSPLQLVLTAPALPAGLATTTVAAADGSTATAPYPTRVAALGPFKLGSRFIDAQYADILGRAPSASERALWDSRLANATAPAALPAGLVTDPALGRYRAPVIRLIYASNLTFSRLTVANWAAKYQSGTSLKAIADSFAASRYPGRPTANFIDDIHRNVLGRPATKAEISSWTAKFKAGTSRGQLIVTLSESASNKAATTNQVRATELYIGMLRRAPTVAESKAAGTTAARAQALLTGTTYAGRYPNG